MSRIVSVWLPRWPIVRYLTAQAASASLKPVDPDEPFVLTITATGGPRITALNEAATATGLAPGEPLADARAKADRLQVRDADTAADDAALRRLALWATRYTPTASPWGDENGADGFFLDMTGAAHLFGGEEKLCADLHARLERFGLTVRLAVADTPGMAWALSRFHSTPSCILPSGKEAEALAALPIEALRLSPQTATALRRLGFKTVGALLDKPRAPFAARFPAELLRRIDQALGRVDEPLVPVAAPPLYHSLRYLIEPVFTQEAIVALAGRLMQTLSPVLVRDGVGARAVRLCLYRIDGAVETVEVGLTLPTRSVPHVTRLIDLKLDALAAARDADCGFEALGLAVTRAEPMTPQQIELSAGHPRDAFQKDDAGDSARCAALIDTLRQRLGPHSVRQFASVESHLPERAEALPPVTGEAAASWQAAEEKARPLLLLPKAEPTEVTAGVPDGPPRRFCWRGVTYDVAGFEGPERIAGEWWQLSANGNPPRDQDARRNDLTRDYYLVEDAGGRRFWLFREGLYGRETASARWFVHGLFA